MLFYEKKMQKYEFGFIGILLLMFLGSVTTIFTYFSLVLSLILSIWIGSYYAKKPSYKCMHWIVLLLLLQNFMLGLGAHISSNFSNSLQLITQIPFLVISIVWFIQFVCLKHVQDTKPRKYFKIYFILIIISLVIGRGSLNAILMNIRNMTVFFMAYEIGVHNITDENSLKNYQKKIIKYGMVMLICGIILLIGGYNLYKEIGIQEVYFAKGGTIINTLEGRFTTTLLKGQVTRMGSLYYEPVNLGYFFAAAFIGACTIKWTKILQMRIFAILITGLGLVLTFGKGAYLIVILNFLSIIFVKIAKVIMNFLSGKFIRKFVLVTAIIIGVIFSIYYYLNVGAASSPHFWGVIQTWGSILRKPYGYGLGTGGNMSQLFSNSELQFSAGAESALMSFMYQYGMQGALLLFLCMKAICVNNKVFLIKNKNYESFYFLPILLFAISILQDNTFTPQCIVPFMLLQGGVYKLSCRKAN